MKTKVLNRIAAVTLSLMFVSTALFAEGSANEVFVSGSSYSAAGDFVVTGTEDVYHFQGEEFKVYNVFYDNPSHNMKIAVKDEANCKTFFAYTNNYWFRYDCSSEGFGVRKVMFNSASVRDTFDPVEYSDQVILVKQKRIEKDQAVSLIAAYLPKLQS